MDKYYRGETVICWRNVKNAAGAYVDPADSMKISISDPLNGSEVDDEVLTPDETGKYHKDYTVPADGHCGQYKVSYTVTDGTRISKEVCTFEVI